MFKAYKLYFTADTAEEIRNAISEHEIDDEIVTHITFTPNEEEPVAKAHTHCDPTLEYLITDA